MGKKCFKARCLYARIEQVNGVCAEPSPKEARGRMLLLFFFTGNVLLWLHCHGGFSILDKLILRVDAQINTKKEFTALFVGQTRARFVPQCAFVITRQQLSVCRMTMAPGVRLTLNFFLHLSRKRESPQLALKKRSLKSVFCRAPYSQHRLRLIKRLQSSVPARTHLPLLDEGTWSLEGEERLVFFFLHAHTLNFPSLWLSLR